MSRKIFSENILREEINKSVEKEIKKYRAELDKIWEYLSKLREEIKCRK